MARHDDLTGLKNRRSIKEISNSFNAVIFLDLDDFKKLNDTYDHDCGDEISREFATRGSQAIREEDILIRWGGEEFIVLLNVLSEKDAMIICERIQTSVRQVFEYEDLKLKVTCSIGLAIDLKDHVKDIHQLINRADQAMYDSK